MNRTEIRRHQFNHHERDHMDDILRGFVVEESPAYIEIESRLGSVIHEQLLSIGMLIENQYDLVIPRYAKRRKNAFYLWLDQHWEQVQGLVKSCVLEEE